MVAKLWQMNTKHRFLRIFPCRVSFETSDAGVPISAVDKDGSVAAAYREAAAAVMATLSGSEAPRAQLV